MRVRPLVFAVVTAAATVLPMKSVLHVAAASPTCRVEATGTFTQPAAVSFQLGELFADEDVEATGICADLAGSAFTATVTVQAEYLDLSTLTWVATDCAGISGSMDANQVSPPNVSEATPFASTGCTYAPGDPSLNTFHRAHAKVFVGAQLFDDETSVPWFMGSASTLI